jgi:RNA polymerase sigma-70 factor (ECF subfamily)
MAELEPSSQQPDDSAGPASQIAWLREVLARHERSLVRYAARITGDAELGRDVAQDTFLRLASVDRAELDGHLVQWLFTVCRRRAIDVRRKEQRMQTLTAEAAAACTCHAPDPTSAVDRRDETVRLKFEHGLSYREIAGVLGITPNHVGVILHTALNAVRQQLKQVDELKFASRLESTNATLASEPRSNRS